MFTVSDILNCLNCCVMFSVGLYIHVCIHISIVGIATFNGLDGTGIEFRWGRGFPYLSRPALGPSQPPIQWVQGLFPGVKAARAWRWPLTPYSAEVKESVELYLYSTSETSWSVMEWTLPLRLPFNGIIYSWDLKRIISFTNCIKVR